MVIIAMAMLAAILNKNERFQRMSIPGKVANLSMIHASHAVRAAGDCSSRLYRRLSLRFHIDRFFEKHSSIRK